MKKEIKVGKRTRSLWATHPLRGLHTSCTTGFAPKT